MTKSMLTSSAVPQPISLNVDLQNALTSGHDGLITENLALWANLAYEQVQPSMAQSDKEVEVTIRLVDESEITELNRDYRGKDKPTNVLSFPFENEFPDLPDLGEGMFDECDVDLLGDVIICHSVIVEEAKTQEKSIADHYAHMVVHGILHLCGYDHLDDPTAQEMEALEVTILAKKQISNPYL